LASIKLEIKRLLAGESKMGKVLQNPADKPVNNCMDLISAPQGELHQIDAPLDNHRSDFL
jgi:hypothetical protein